MWQASCILLGLALSKSSIIVSVVKMVYFKLGNKMWQVNWSTWHASMGQRKNLSPRQESNPWPPKHRAGVLSTELRELMESKAIFLSSYVTGILHTLVHLIPILFSHYIPCQKTNVDEAIQEAARDVTSYRSWHTGCIPFGQKIRKFRFEVKW